MWTGLDVGTLFKYPVIKSKLIIPAHNNVSRIAVVIWLWCAINTL